MFVILVEFRIEPERLEEFIALVNENAEHSQRDEPGCRRFDVLTPVSEESKVVLYEIYDSRAAFEIHKASAHVQQFDAATARMVIDKGVTELVLHFPLA